MSRESVKESRVTMRLVLDHLYHIQDEQGAIREVIGFVDVVRHPFSSSPALNYVTPRRNTAWVSGKHIEGGLDVMREQDRVPRVNYLDALFPPVFGQSLAKIGMILGHEMPIMVYHRDDAIMPSSVPEAVHVVPVNKQQGMAMWWYVWHHADYAVSTTSAEPLLLTRDLSVSAPGSHSDLVLYHHGFPIGIVRLTRHDTSAHLAAIAIMREMQSPLLMRALRGAVLQHALDQGCDLVFAICHDEAECTLYQDLGWEALGSIVSYVEPDFVPEHDAVSEVQSDPTVLLI